VIASVLGSGTVFLESSVVNVALPAMGHDLGLDLAGLQWVIDGYLLTLSALILLGGSLGDVLGRRRVFTWGAAAFAVATVLCAIAPSFGALLAFRLLQGAAGALLVPNSLAMLDVAFEGAERGAAIGQWAGWSAISTAVGPLLGGWIVDAASWRWVFALIAPASLAAAWIAQRGVPDDHAVIDAAPGRKEAKRRIDWRGAALATAGLAGVVGALIEASRSAGHRGAIFAVGIAGVALLVIFVVVERRTPEPLLPVTMFRSRQFTGANIVTFLVYAPLSAVVFLLVLQLQNVLGYSAIEAGAALMPQSVLMLALSPIAGRLAQRVGPRAPMTAGALVAATGMLLLARVQPGAGFIPGVLPGVVVFGVGLSLLVAPLTTAVLGAVDDSHVGTASATNTAVARVAGLLATALLPLAAGMTGAGPIDSATFAGGFARAMGICAALCGVGAVVAWSMVRKPSLSAA
jgi:EmrB/QacA subfamily drug resistance transporter